MEKLNQFWRQQIGLLSVLPYLLAITAVVVGPIVLISVKTFESRDGAFTLENLEAAFAGQFRSAYVQSLALAGSSTLLAAVTGTAIAIALSNIDSRGLAKAVVSASAIFANSGGIPLAFAYIALLGYGGLLTLGLERVGVHIYDHGFSLYSTVGLCIVYQFFLIPLAMLVMLPAVQEFKPEWREASQLLGASTFDFWRLVALPILWPPFSAALLVLFCQAFTSYASASALTNGVIPLVPIQIGALMRGDTMADQENLGSALGFGMIVIMALAASALMLRRRSKAAEGTLW